MEANINEVKTPSASNAETTRKMYEDESVDFGLIIAANKVNTTIQARMQELEYSDSSDEEDDQSHDLEIHAHELGETDENGLIDFSCSDEERPRSAVI